uniref:hypothetical protein n=1 Tax=Agathobacter sp. TaxID=2021311 RepID=UPI004057C3F9
MTAEIMMKEYSSMKRELSILEFQLQQFKGVDENDIIMAMQFSHQEGDRVHTSTLSDKTASIAMNYRKIMARENDEWFDFLWNRYQFLKAELDFFEHSVERLNGQLPSVIRDLLNKDLTWDSIAGKYHVSTTMISKYRKAAIKELNACYELRDRQAEAFMLS